ncbi:fumarate hydratase [bacterium]|nr:fumarate hydratase [bacterium]
MTQKRVIAKDEIINVVKKMCIEANCIVPDDMLDVFKKFRETEKSPIGRETLDQIIENARIGKDENMPTCQDTGLAIFFVEIGSDIEIDGGLHKLEEYINEGTRQGYEEGYLRKSVVEHPYKRVNTKDNTPAIIYYKPVAGDKLKIKFTSKGGGSENMSKVNMMKPADGREGIKKWIVEAVTIAGANPCPPTVLGIGIGGNFEKAAIMAKEALFRNIGERHPDPDIAALEEEILEEVNKTGVGPQGLGGSTTSLEVFINYAPCHIASMPVALNINCHAQRHREVEL